MDEILSDRVRTRVFAVPSKAGFGPCRTGGRIPILFSNLIGGFGVLSSNQVVNRDCCGFDCFFLSDNVQGNWDVDRDRRSLQSAPYAREHGFFPRHVDLRLPFGIGRLWIGYVGAEGTIQKMGKK